MWRLPVLWLTATALWGCDPGARADDAGAENADDSGEISIAGSRFQADNLIQFKLPKRLREVSGLALTDAGTLLAHNDELAVVYQLNIEDGLVGGYLQLGNPPAADDFEGIATTHQRLYLVTSRGAIYEANLPGRSGQAAGDSADERAVSSRVTSFTHHDAVLPCEVEGLTFDESLGALLAACKHIYDDDEGDKPVIRVYAWNLDRRAYDPEPFLQLTESDFEGITPGLKKLRPSGITLTDTGNLLLVSRHGSRPALLEITRKGAVVALAEIPWKKKHHQTEGIVLTDTNQLVLADEGGKSRKGRLGVYQPH